jgi:hypothetical protein
MSGKVALKMAIDLKLVPSQVRLLRSEPLAEGVVTLLHIAAGDEEVEQAAAEVVGRSREFIRSAATFFIEQILFAPGADSYRVLGANAQAPANELRQHVGLLMRWVHPDLDPQGDRSIYCGRVTAAWNDLKSPERRSAYDEEQRNKSKAPNKARAKARNPPFQRAAKKSPWGAAERHPGADTLPRRGNALPPMESFWRRALWVLMHPDG